MMQKSITLNVHGMTCGHCTSAVEKALSNLGVENAQASLDEKTVSLRYDPQKVSLEQIRHAIQEEGYEVK